MLCVLFAHPYADRSRANRRLVAALDGLPIDALRRRIRRNAKGAGRVTRRAGDLLTRTRLLIDSPASSDPQIHELLEDLELVLAQIVRLKADTTDHTELDLINRALEQRDVIPRLRTAVEDISAY